MLAIKLRKRLKKFMITISLPKELGGKGFITTAEVIYVRRCSSETNKLRYIHSIRGTPRDITIEEQEINYIKFTIVPFIINFSGNCTIRFDKFKSKKVASVSEELALFN